jgi:hypothetical protein
MSDDRLDRFVSAAWRWTAAFAAVLALGGLLDLLGVIA